MRRYCVRNLSRVFQKVRHRKCCKGADGAAGQGHTNPDTQGLSQQPAAVPCLPLAAVSWLATPGPWREKLAVAGGTALEGLREASRASPLESPRCFPASPPRARALFGRACGTARLVTERVGQTGRASMPVPRSGCARNTVMQMSTKYLSATSTIGMPSPAIRSRRTGRLGRLGVRQPRTSEQRSGQRPLVELSSPSRLVEPSPFNAF